MPAGTATARRGAPAGLLGLTLFGVGFFGASTLVTLLFTTVYGATLGAAGIALGAAPVAWAVASIGLDRLDRRNLHLPPTAGVVLSAVCVTALGPLGEAGAPFWIGAGLWAAAGAAVGLFYPTLYLRATTPAGSLTETQVATAAISAESFGALVGAAVGGFVVSTEGTRLVAGAFATSYVLFGLALVVAAVCAMRTPDMRLVSPEAGGAAG